jgi:hypothetical protein
MTALRLRFSAMKVQTSSDGRPKFSFAFSMQMRNLGLATSSSTVWRSGGY